MTDFQEVIEMLEKARALVASAQYELDDILDDRQGPDCHELLENAYDAISDVMQDIGAFDRG